MVDELPLKFIYYSPPARSSSNLCWQELIRAHQSGKRSGSGAAQVRQGVSQGPSGLCLWRFGYRKLGETHDQHMQEHSQIRINPLFSFLHLFKLLGLKDMKLCL